MKYEGCDDTTNLYTTFAQLTLKDLKELTTVCRENELIAQNEKYIPDSIPQRLKIVTIENAGVYYKTGKGVTTSRIHLTIPRSLAYRHTDSIANVTLIAVSEEKYHFTPDLFKGATIAQRRTAVENSIAHLQTAKERQ